MKFYITLEIITPSVQKNCGQTLNQSLKSRSNDPPLILDEASRLDQRSKTAESCRKNNLKKVAMLAMFLTLFDFFKVFAVKKMDAF